MPETFECIERIHSQLDVNGAAITFLVVPGREWQPAQIERMAEWARQGHMLAAHGWHHRIGRIGGIRHWLHSLFFSRDVAEHLALDEEEIAELMRRSHAWFSDHGLPSPSLYVPPAWALGSIPRDALRRLPFSQVEATRGVLEASSGRLRRLPLAGFEADTAMRACILKRWNHLQMSRARRDGQPLRLSIHPHDFELRLAHSLRQTLQRHWQFLHYPTVLD